MRGSLAAMIRAAELAREIAIQTNTAIVIVKDGKPVRVTAEELRKEREATAILPNQPLSSDVRMIQQSGRKVRS